MNFAPYQDQSPEIERAFSPPPSTKGRPSIDATRGLLSPPQRPQTHSRTVSDVQPLPPPSYFGNDEPTTAAAERGRGLDVFETSLPLRMDYEAMIAYLFFPPIGGLFLLVVEHKSDYVRFHAWQSSMLFAAVIVVHLFFTWSRAISWTLFVLDILLIGFLARHAYHDVDTLEHYEVPIIGRLANRWVENE